MCHVLIYIKKLYPSFTYTAFHFLDFHKERREGFGRELLKEPQRKILGREEGHNPAISYVKKIEKGIYTKTIQIFNGVQKGNREL